MLTTIISSGNVKNTDDHSLIYAIISHPSTENEGGEKNALVVSFMPVVDQLLACLSEPLKMNLRRLVTACEPTRV